MNIIITGANRGIGKALAEAFAKEGNRLFLCGRNEVTLYNTVAELATKYPGSSIRGKACDLSVKEEAQQFGTWCLEQGVPDILINNAGSFLPGSVCDEEEGFLEEMIGNNLYSAYYLTRSVVHSMKEAKKGHIFNICSIAALQAYNNGGGYSISKFAMMGFSKNLREELKAFNVKVTTVYPGATLTDSWGDYDNSSKRIMEASDIADTILASTKLSPQATIEDIVIRPQLGDL